MKLTSVVIVAVLFLAACQLTTSDGSRGTWKDRAVRSITKVSMLRWPCKVAGSPCGLVSECCGTCNVLRNRCV
uniref:Conotoxin Lt6.3 n=1 Tax=Conus litteratus TaxID=89445 RepID=O163_CONLT|nr:RecName: Full=Conotoxin Lt6.3; AltName: Full=Lt6c; Flags: Precursor [Conus litteratus]ABC74978.1 O superfamily conotoxin lt6c precursor [Conus litteratus]UMA82238.1 conotoxin precursor O1 [Conus ebraeus]UMA83796.1 conotoxin precursor O1 [Conus judaeus]